MASWLAFSGEYAKRECFIAKTRWHPHASFKDTCRERGFEGMKIIYHLYTVYTVCITSLWWYIITIHTSKTPLLFLEMPTWKKVKHTMSQCQLAKQKRKENNHKTNKHAASLLPLQALSPILSQKTGPVERKATPAGQRRRWCDYTPTEVWPATPSPAGGGWTGGGGSVRFLPGVHGD